MGWNFFQHDPEFGANVRTMENGYFRCDTWWENTDTQAVMCIGALTCSPYSDGQIIKMAADIMEPNQPTPKACRLMMPGKICSSMTVFL